MCVNNDVMFCCALYGSSRAVLTHSPGKSPPTSLWEVNIEVYMGACQTLYGILYIYVHYTLDIIYTCTHSTSNVLYVCMYVSLLLKSTSQQHSSTSMLPPLLLSQILDPLEKYFLPQVNIFPPRKRLNIRTFFLKYYSHHAS